MTILAFLKLIQEKTVKEMHEHVTENPRETSNTRFHDRYTSILALMDQAERQERGERFSQIHIDNCWQSILRTTRGTNFWDEFKGNAEARSALEGFLHPK